ncbi:MAG: tetratricopeptide repeat protein [Aridibacter famidurans]|nr:tetratricopeptide repeat protein [Aridibacter famidurans]
MNTKIIAAAVIGILAGFAAGFLIANSLNRSELEAAQAEAAQLRRSSPSAGTRAENMELSDEEIRKKIAEADQNADNFQYQKTLGLALYTYAAMKQDARLLEDVAKLLERAHKLNPDDYDVLVSLGNISFDLGQIKKDEALNEKARDLYRNALTKNEKDANVRTSLGVSFLAAQNPDPKKAIEELTAAIEIDPKNDKALRYLAQAYAEAGDKENGAKYLEELKKIDPENPAVAELEKKIGS